MHSDSREVRVKNDDPKMVFLNTIDVQPLSEVYDFKGCSINNQQFYPVKFIRMKSEANLTGATINNPSNGTPCIPEAVSSRRSTTGFAANHLRPFCPRYR